MPSSTNNDKKAVSSPSSSSSSGHRRRHSVSNSTPPFSSVLMVSTLYHNFCKKKAQVFFFRETASVIDWWLDFFAWSQSKLSLRYMLSNIANVQRYFFRINALTCFWRHYFKKNSILGLRGGGRPGRPPPLLPLPGADVVLSRRRVGNCGGVQVSKLKKKLKGGRNSARDRRKSFDLQKDKGKEH